MHQHLKLFTTVQNSRPAQLESFCRQQNDGNTKIRISFGIVGIILGKGRLKTHNCFFFFIFFECFFLMTVKNRDCVVKNQTSFV